ncbi:hypothetical protein CsSME_00001751 [Camellia sinensis var. sinensis]
MGVPAYLQPDLEADLVLPPAPASRVDNHIRKIVSKCASSIDVSWTFVQLFPSLVDLPKRDALEADMGMEIEGDGRARISSTRSGSRSCLASCTSWQSRQPSNF